MEKEVNRREFLQLTAVGGAMCLGAPSILAFGANPKRSRLISPGCRGTKVKVARIYMGRPENPYWPKPELDLKKEIRFYESEFAKLKDELSDVEFVVDELVASPEQVAVLKHRLKDVDGVLVIHLTMGTGGILKEILKLQKPTTVFAVPYSGHQWTAFGALRKQELGAKLECILTGDYKQLAVAIRPFRAIHHLREVQRLNKSNSNECLMLVKPSVTAKQRLSPTAGFGRPLKLSNPLKRKYSSPANWHWLLKSC